MLRVAAVFAVDVVTVGGAADDVGSAAEGGSCAMAVSSIETNRLSVRERLAVIGIVWRSSQHVADVRAVDGGSSRNVTVFTASLSSAIVANSSICAGLIHQPNKNKYTNEK